MSWCPRLEPKKNDSCVNSHNNDDDNNHINNHCSFHRNHRLQRVSGAPSNSRQSMPASAAMLLYIRPSVAVDRCQHREPAGVIFLARDLSLRQERFGCTVAAGTCTEPTHVVQFTRGSTTLSNRVHAVANQAACTAAVRTWRVARKVRGVVHQHVDDLDSRNTAHDGGVRSVPCRTESFSSRSKHLLQLHAHVHCNSNRKGGIRCRRNRR